MRSSHEIESSLSAVRAAWQSAGDQYGVFKEDLGFAMRGTFLIDTDGVVRAKFVNGPGEARDLASYHQALAAL